MLFLWQREWFHEREGCSNKTLDLYVLVDYAKRYFCFFFQFWGAIMMKEKKGKI